MTTESVYLELKKQYQDFYFFIEGGTWKHFELQSTDGGIKDLKRFRSYESVASYTHGVEITNEASDIAPHERQKIEAMIYIMADKFLDSMNMEEVETAIKMTRLGQMLYKDGFNDGFNNGFDNGFDDGFMNGTDKTKLESAINLLNALDVRTIAECIGLPVETVQKLKDEKSNPP